MSELEVLDNMASQQAMQYIPVLEVRRIGSIRLQALHYQHGVETIRLRTVYSHYLQPRYVSPMKRAYLFEYAEC